MSEINPGDVVRVRTNDPDVAGSGFKDVAGVLTDPTAVKLKWRAAGGPTTTWVYLTDSQVVKDSVGVYHADIPVTMAGLHYFRLEGTGAVVAAEESTFSVGTYF
jgi:hypothetical protein